MAIVFGDASSLSSSCPFRNSKWISSGRNPNILAYSLLVGAGIGYRPMTNSTNDSPKLHTSDWML
jgi:hypothetical protein